MKLFSPSLVVLGCFICVVGLEGCRDCKPRDYYLNDYSKTWIGYASSEAIFKNDYGEMITYTYSNAEEGTEHYGVECGNIDALEKISFTMNSESLEYVFNFSLTAVSYGAPWNSDFTIDYEDDPRTSCHEGFPFHLDSNFVVNPPPFYDVLDVNGIMYQNVYHLPFTSASCPLTDWYFNKDWGIIAFKTKEGIFWLLQ